MTMASYTRTSTRREGLFSLELDSNRLNEIIASDRFGHICVAAGLKAFSLVTFHGVGRQCNNRPGVAAGPQMLRGEIAIHDGHLHVHEDNIKWLSSVSRPQGQIRGDLAIVCDSHPATGRLKNACKESLIVNAVFSKEYLARGQPSFVRP